MEREMIKEDVAEKIAQCRAAQKAWAVVPWKEKSRILKAAGRYIGKNADVLTEIIHTENGKLAIDAIAAEVLPTVMAVGYYRKRGKKLLAPRRISGGNILMCNKQSRIIYKPYGVIGIISPWNYPFAIPFSEVVMALLAGNAVILKVASVTPSVGRAIETIFSSIGLPKGLFAYVELLGKEAGNAFITGGIDKLFFTGSTATGRELMALAAPRLLPLVLELGGSDAAIIREDADIDRAVSGIIWAGFSNAGQSCGGVQRVIVHKAIYDAFLQKLCTRVKNLRMGTDTESDLGPMSTLKQKETSTVQINECLAKGAHIAAQSNTEASDGGGLFAPAVVLTHVTRDMPVMSGEIFGPVVAVIPAEDDEDAIAIANDSPYGLTGSVWTRNKRKAQQIAARIHAGAVMINDHLMSHGLAETPWGGFGDSGLGRTHGEEGLREMARPQVIVDDIFPLVKKNIFWHPYSQKVYDGIKAILTLLTGNDPFKRLAALPKVLGIFFRYWEK
jgi:succinate-semialdehyde dehydrogenase/glutarate-semialdehyde dehydrogenase